MGEGTGNRSIIGRLQIGRERSKMGLGNRGFKELTCTTNGHKTKGRENAGGLGGAGWRIKGGKLGKL